MKVVILGSIKHNSDVITSVANFWKGHNVDVIYPIDSIKTKNLLDIQMNYINEIEDADLVLAIPKKIVDGVNGYYNCTFEFGESVSYEMAIAKHFRKPVAIVTDYRLYSN